MILCIRNFPSQYRNHFRGLSGHNAGSFYLSAAYDTVWLRGLHIKLLQMIPDRHMVKFIMEMLYNRSFTLNTRDGQCSRQRRLKNGVPQGSVLAPMLFNVYIHDLPVTQAKKYGYADDLAILLRKKSWEDIEGGLTADMTVLSTYLENWRLKLSIAKTMSSVFHLHNHLNTSANSSTLLTSNSSVTRAFRNLPPSYKTTSLSPCDRSNINLTFLHLASLGPPLIRTLTQLPADRSHRLPRQQPRLLSDR